MLKIILDASCLDINYVISALRLKITYIEIYRYISLLILSHMCLNILYHKLWKTHNRDDKP